MTPSFKLLDADSIESASKNKYTEITKGFEQGQYNDTLTKVVSANRIRFVTSLVPSNT